MSEHRPIGGKTFTGTFAVAFLIALVGGWFLIQRFAQLIKVCVFPVDPESCVWLQ